MQDNIHLGNFNIRGSELKCSKTLEGAIWIPDVPMMPKMLPMYYCGLLIYFLSWCFSDLAVWRESGNPSLLSRGSHLSEESTILEKQGIGQQRAGGRSLDGRIQRSVLPSQPSCSSGTPTCAVCCITLALLACLLVFREYVYHAVYLWEKSRSTHIALVKDANFLCTNLDISSPTLTESVDKI